MAPLDPMIARLRAAADELTAMRPAVEAGWPWPLAEHFGTEPEASWGPPELLAHATEMLPFWLGEIERILADPPGTVRFGRLETDAQRLGLIERDRRLPARELFARLDNGVDRYVRRLPELDEADIARSGVHPTRGEVTVGGVLENMVVGHLEGHARQLRSILDRG
jgi:hypothetical protein